MARQIRIRPAPADTQVQPWLPAQQLTLEEAWSASPEQLELGQPLTRTLALIADGLTAARFELFHRGVELANGFHELTDADEQAARFEADNCARRSSGLPPVRIDRRLLGAMQHGLPGCAGVAVGLDRLLMLRLGRNDIDEVLSFSLQRC